MSEWEVLYNIPSTYNALNKGIQFTKGRGSPQGTVLNVLFLEIFIYFINIIFFFPPLETAQ